MLVHYLFSLTRHVFYMLLLIKLIKKEKLDNYFFFVLPFWNAPFFDNDPYKAIKCAPVLQKHSFLSHIVVEVNH